MHIYKVTLVGTEASADHEYTNISLYLLIQDSVFMFSGAQVRLIDDVMFSLCAPVQGNGTHGSVL